MRAIADDNKRAIAAAGGIGVVTATLKSHAGDALAVEAAGFMALRNLAFDCASRLSLAGGTLALFVCVFGMAASRCGWFAFSVL